MLCAIPKQLFQMTGRSLSAVLVAALMLPVASSWADLPASQHYGNVEYVTGGFGADESAALKSAMPDYPLALTFSAGNGGRAAYVSQVQVVIRDSNDATVLNVESRGPFLLARIMPGSYQIHATYRNQTQSRALTITDGKSTRMVFEWSREALQSTDDALKEETGSQPSRQFAPGSIPGLD